MVPVAIAIQGREHDTEGAGPLAEEDEEMVSKTLLREKETPMMHCKETQIGCQNKDLEKLIH